MSITCSLNNFGCTFSISFVGFVLSSSLDLSSSLIFGLSFGLSICLCFGFRFDFDFARPLLLGAGNSALEVTE